MSVHSQPGPAPEESAEPQEANDRSAFDAMFRVYADHVFEYCNGLLGDDEAAAAATQATFIAAYSLIRYLRNPSRTEAWLYALARRECTSKDPGRTELPPMGSGQAGAGRAGGGAGAVPAAVDADTDEFAAIPGAAPGEQATAEALAALTARPERDRAVLAAFGRLRPRDREIIDLLYWRGIDRSELPSILGVPTRQAAALVTVAEKNLDRLARRGRHGPEPETRLLAVMPATVWPRTLSSVFDDEYASRREAVTIHAGLLDAEGFPEQPSPPALRARNALTTSSVAVPAVAGLVVLGAFGGSAVPRGTSPSDLAPHGVIIGLPDPGLSGGTQSLGAHRARAHAHHHRQLAVGPSPAATLPAVAPVQPTGHPHASPSPAPITSAPPTLSPSPSPSPTPHKTSPSPTPSPSSPSPTSTPSPNAS